LIAAGQGGQQMPHIRGCRDDAQAFHLVADGQAVPYRRYHDDDDDDGASGDGFEVDEVFERSLTLSHWSQPDGGIAVLGTLPFTDAEVCPGDALIEMDPDEQAPRLTC